VHELPVDIDVSVLIQNIRVRAGLRSVSSVARAAHVPEHTVRGIIGGRYASASYRTLAKLINLHLKFLPDAPHPAKTPRP
jgi:hypothetical protein